MFLTVKILEDTPAVLSCGKLCEDHGYSYEWANGQKPCLIKNGVRINCNTENYVPIVVPGLSTASSSSSSSATPTSLTQESTGSVSIPAWLDNDRADECERRNPVQDPAKNSKTNKMRITHTNGLTRLIPKYLNGFKNSVKISWIETFLKLICVSHASSSHEPSSEPLSRVESGNHSICTYFRKSVRGPKSQGPLTEDVLVEWYLPQKILVT